MSWANDNDTIPLLRRTDKRIEQDTCHGDVSVGKRNQPRCSNIFLHWSADYIISCMCTRNSFRLHNQNTRPVANCMTDTRGLKPIHRLGILTRNRIPRQCNVFVRVKSTLCCCSSRISHVTHPIGYLTLQKRGRVIITFIGAHVARHLRGEREYLRIPSDDRKAGGTKLCSLGSAGCGRPHTSTREFATLRNGAHPRFHQLAVQPLNERGARGRKGRRGNELDARERWGERVLDCVRREGLLVRSKVLIAWQCL